MVSLQNMKDLSVLQSEKTTTTEYEDNLKIQFHSGGSQISFWGGAKSSRTVGLCPSI